MRRVWMSLHFSKIYIIFVRQLYADGYVQEAGEADIMIKSVYQRLFWRFEILQNFTNPKQEGSKRPLGYDYPAAERPCVDCSVWWHSIFGVGVNCLFLLVGSCRNLESKDKQR